MNSYIISHIFNTMRYALCTMLLFLIAGSSYGATYTLTKHGTDANRSAFDSAFPYTINGHCAHCHEQHASIDGDEPGPPGFEGPTAYTLFRSNFGIGKNEL